jgi:hypothetical protein
MGPRGDDAEAVIHLPLVPVLVLMAFQTDKTSATSQAVTKSKD